MFEMSPLSPWKILAALIFNTVGIYSSQKYLISTISSWSTLPNSNICTLLLLFCLSLDLKLQDNSTLHHLKAGIQLLRSCCNLTHRKFTKVKFTEAGPLGFTQEGDNFIPNLIPLYSNSLWYSGQSSQGLSTLLLRCACISVLRTCSWLYKNKLTKINCFQILPFYFAKWLVSLKFVVAYFIYFFTEVKKKALPLLILFFFVFVYLFQ